MLSKHILFSLLVLLLTAGVAAAQVGQLRGRVAIRQADSTEVPASGAMIDVFRIDLTAKYSTKTDQKGDFVFAGLPYNGSYLLTASLAGAKPGVVADVIVGTENEYRIVLEPGDGQRLTLEEAKSAAAGTKTAITPVETNDELGARAFKEGVVALSAKNYDEAIRLFNLAVGALPPQPAPLINLSIALRSRGVEKHNVTVDRNDNAARAAKEQVQKDLRGAVEAATQGVDLIRIQPISEKDDDRRRQQTVRNMAFQARFEALRILLVTVDPSQAEMALSAFREYVEVEDDEAKKSQAELGAAKMLADSKNYGLALEQYRQILMRDPNEIEALAGLGLTIYRSGDRQRFVEAAGYLKRFMKEAPESHVLRPAVAEALRKLSSPQ